MRRGSGSLNDGCDDGASGSFQHLERESDGAVESVSAIYLGIQGKASERIAVHETRKNDAHIGWKHGKNANSCINCFFMPLFLFFSFRRSTFTRDMFCFRAIIRVILFNFVICTEDIAAYQKIDLRKEETALPENVKMGLHYSPLCLP